MEKDSIDYNFETSYRKHSPNGTIKDFCDYYIQTGRSCQIGFNNSCLWIPNSRGELLRLPLEYNEEPEKKEIEMVLKNKGIWVASYVTKPNGTQVANCYDYVCSDAEYCIEKLGYNARRDIRRGFRSFKIRLCSVDELIQSGYRANADTFIRHKYTVPSEEEYRKMIKLKRDCPFLEFWGAWENDLLVAWMEIMKIENWTIINVARSSNSHLRLCPNNALLYGATFHVLRNEKKNFITYGLSSLQVDVNQSSMHTYKVKMGYEAIPVHRAFILHPLLRTFATSKSLTWLFTQSSKILPQIAFLKKVAGMCQQFTGSNKAMLEMESRHNNEADRSQNI